MNTVIPECVVMSLDEMKIEADLQPSKLVTTRPKG